MEVAELENLGVELCHSLLNQDYASIAQRFGYAIAFKKAPATAIKEGFENSVMESGGALENSTFSVTVKVFPNGTPGFINLIECRFIFANSKKEVLAEIIENEAGFYLEQISCEIPPPLCGSVCLMMEEEYVSELRKRWPEDYESVEPTKETMDLTLEALKKFPESEKLWIIRGDLLQLVNSADGAELNEIEKCYRKAMAINPQSVEANDELGHFLYVVMGKPRKAKQYFAKARRLKKHKRLHR